MLESGVKIVLDETKLEDYVRDADLVITGEGRLDGQTVMGKAPIGVAKTAKKYGKPVIGFSGCVTKDAVACNREGIDAFFPILRGVVTLGRGDEDGERRCELSGYGGAGVPSDPGHGIEEQDIKTNTGLCVAAEAGTGFYGFKVQ